MFDPDEEVPNFSAGGRQLRTIIGSSSFVFDRSIDVIGGKGSYDGGDPEHQFGLQDVRHWVNDGLMTLFFFVVALEIKRELVVGELNDVRKAMIPLVAAAGGMVAPALLYVVLNAGGAGAAGWGIPMATDIAFAVGILALLSNRIPSGLKVFLLSLAIVDDIGAILVIALFIREASSSAGWSQRLVY